MKTKYKDYKWKPSKKMLSEIEQRIAVQFKPPGYYTIRQMQENLKVSRVRIYQLILSKKLIKTRIGKYSYVKLNRKEN